MIDYFEELKIDLPANNEIDNMTEIVAVAKLKNYLNDWEWFIVSGDKLDNGDYYCYGLVNGEFSEFGYFLLSDVLDNGGMFCLLFKPTVIQNL